jgi:diacylglycerol O-acyltransferase-1
MAKKDGHTSSDFSESSNGDIPRQSAAETRLPARSALKKYNHLFAIHSTTKVTILSSQDAEKAPSFVGFRNLMVLMLCEASMASNLRVH